MALAIIGAVFANGYVKNKVMEFVGPGVAEFKCRFPYRHRCYDNRDYLSFFYLAEQMRRFRSSMRSTAERRIIKN